MIVLDGTQSDAQKREETTAQSDGSLEMVFNECFGKKMPPIPPTWRDEGKQAMQAVQVSMDSVGLFAPQQPRPDADSDGNATAEEVDLQAAAASGRFDMRGSVGRMWNKAKESDPELAEAYKMVGKSYDAQRNFRHKWAEQKHQEVKAERLKREVSELEDEDIGDYVPFTVLWQREGGDEAAFMAAKNYLVSALRLHNSGQTISKRPWLNYNNMTKRMEILHVKKRFTIRMREMWERRTSEVAVGNASGGSTASASGGSTAGASGGSTAGASGGLTAVARADPPQKKHRQSVKTGQAAAAKPAQNGTDTEGELATLVAKSKMLKASVLGAMSSANDLILLIENQIEWAWANNEVLKKPIHGLMGEIRTFQVSSQFWKDWVVTDVKKWALVVQKSYINKVALQELRSMDSLESFVKDLNMHCSQLKSMHAARMGVVSA